MKHNWKENTFTIPNLLTCSRIALIPIYTALYLNENYLQSAAVLAVSCLTDFADGYIARKFNMITTFGKILDPIADKATQLTLLICFSVRYWPLRYVLFLFTIKETFQALAGICFLRSGKILPGSLWAGKICTTALFISLLILVLFPQIKIGAVKLLAELDAVFLAIAFAAYIAAYFGKRSRLEDYTA